MLGNNLLFEIMAIVLTVIICGVGGLGIGMYMDPMQRGKIMRKTFWKNLMGVCIVSRDNKDVRMRLVNPDGGVLKVGKRVWVLDKNRIYRQDKPDEGFYIRKEDIKYNEGLPCVFVNEEDIKPVDFFKNDEQSDPEAIGAVINAWLMVQYAKGLAKMQTAQMIAIITLVVCAALVLGTYVTINNTQTLLKGQDDMKINIATCMGMFAPQTEPVGEAGGVTYSGGKKG